MRTNSTKPWFRKVKNCWYIWLDGKQISLKVFGKENKKQALIAFHRLLAQGEPTKVKSNQITVKEIAELFLTDAKTRVKPETMAVWNSCVNRFVKKFGEREATSLTPQEVETFAKRPNISNSTINSFLTSIATMTKWAFRGRLININPLDGLRKPPCESRGFKIVLTDQQFLSLLDSTNASFKPFLLGLWLTGCRPGELCRLTVEDVNLEQGVATLKDHKTVAKTGKPRLIFLSAAAIELIKAQGRTEGIIFRNTVGNAWTRFTWQKAIEAARKKAGLPHAIAYSMRHSFATAALVNGIPDATVAALLGHTGTAMLHKHYSHLSSRVDVLKEAVDKVR